MNPHPPTAPAPPPSGQYQHHPRRQHQEYHQYQPYGVPPSPNTYNPYAPPFPSQYYAHPMHMPYQMQQRWVPPPQAYAPYPMQMQIQNGPRSPMVMSSQPHHAHIPHQRQSPYVPATIPATLPYSNTATNESQHSPSLPSPLEQAPKSATPSVTSRRSSTLAPLAPSSRVIPYYPDVRLGPLGSVIMADLP